MGNRGCLHDAEQRIRRAFGSRRWIICVLEFKGRRRAVMAPGHYTELFFLDEATALAAGHRPCAECQGDRYRVFQGRWAAGNPRVAGRSVPPADAIDAVLHAERLADRGRRGARRAGRLERASRLPPGTMAADAEGHAYLVRGDRLLLWTTAGYRASASVMMDAELRVLTPPSTVRAIAHGYPVGVHASATTA